MRRLAWTAVFLAACSGNDREPGPPVVIVDAGSSRDAGTDEPPRDAGTTDAGSRDGGTRDGGPHDGGARDGGPRDGGTRDGGSTPACAWPLGAPLGNGVNPPPRRDHAIAADPECRRVLIFGGNDAVPNNCAPTAANYLGDFYTYDLATNAWYTQPVASGVAPGPRARAGAVWDPMRRRFVMFGGRYRAGTTGNYTHYDELWAYDVTTQTWSPLVSGAPTSPSPRMGLVMEADPTRDRFVLHGGGEATSLEFIPRNDTWAYSYALADWSRIGLISAPPGRLLHAGALDSAAGHLDIFGGGDENAFFGFRAEAWRLDFGTDTWTQHPMGPGERAFTHMVHDADSGASVVFGGNTAEQIGIDNDLWRLAGSPPTWTRVRQGDVYANPARGFCDFPGDFTTADLASPERRDGAGFVAVSSSEAILFGGRSDCGVLNDTWHLDLSTNTWTEQIVSDAGLTCPRRAGASCAGANSNLCE
ncbi:MAG: kelch repeat-containing protein [Deltaproteobacteria bacterium]|jgi:hypothetical protein